jgi:hypothetical protein
MKLRHLTTSTLRFLAPLMALFTLGGCASSFTGALPQRLLSEPVPTESGLVTGDSQDVRAFRGIPPAHAPIGPLRWWAPFPPAHFTKPLFCKGFFYFFI